MNARTRRFVSARAPRSRGLFEALEPRQLLASTFSGTDVDGDTYVVEVLGNGSAAVTTSNGGTSGFLENVVLSGTDLKSTLRITVTQVGGGDGEVLLRGLSAGDLGFVNAPKVNADNDAVWTLGQVKGVTANDMLDVEMAVNGPAATKVAFRFQVVDGLLVSCSQRVALYQAQQDFGAELDFDEGVDSIVVAQDFDADIDVIGAAPVSIGKVQVGGGINADWDVTGEVGAVSVGSVGSAFDLNNATFLKSLKASGDIRGQFRSLRFGPISSGGGMIADFFAGPGDALGVAFASITVVGTFQARIESLTMAPAGAIKKLVAGSILGTEITCTGIDVLTVKGDATDLAINVSQGARPVSLGTVKIGGVVSGSLTVGTRVNSFTAFASSGLNIANPGFAGSIGLVKFTSTGQSIVTVSAGTLTALQCAGTLTGFLDLRAEIGATGLSMRSLRAARVSGFTVSGTTAGGLDVLVANRFQSAVVNFAFINTIDVRAVVGSAELTGSLSETTFLCDELRPGTLFSITSLKTGGEVINTSATLLGGIGSFTAPRLVQSTWNAAFVDTLTLGSAATGVNVLQSASLNLTGANAKGQSLGKGTLKGRLTGVTLNFNGGAIGEFKANGLSGASVSAQGVQKKLTFAPGNGFDGLVENFNMNFLAATPTGVGDLVFARVQNGSVSAGGGIKSFTAESVRNFTMSAGVSSLFDVFEFIDPLPGSAAAIGSFRLTRAFDLANPAMESSIVVARSIGSLSINGAVQAANMGSTFGFAANTYGPISLRDGGGAIIKPAAPAAPGTLTPLGGDFVIRAVV